MVAAYDRSARCPLVTAIRPGLPAAVSKVVARAMDRQPGRRYGSCLAFADALREALGLPPSGAEATPARPRGT